MALGASFVVGFSDTWGMVGWFEGLTGKARRVCGYMVVDGWDVGTAGGLVE